MKFIAVLPLLIFCNPFLHAQSWFTTGQSADFMLSGIDFNNCGGPLTFNHPNGLASDGSNLLVCDRFNNRVLIWKSAPSAWNDVPDLVLGQENFTTNNPGKTKNQLNWPGNVSVAANGVVAVADTDNDRILIWKTFPAANGQAADISLELPALTPQGAQQIFSWPWGVWTDGTRLAAVATQGHAILFWDELPANDNQPADYTIDLPQMGTPRNISTDGATYFFVGDHNAKVNNVPGTFFWNTYPTAEDQPYDFYRDEWIKGEKLPGGGLIAGGLSNIYSWNNFPANASASPDFAVAPAFYENGDGVDVALADGKIYINNYNGNNVLVYDTPPQSAADLPVFALGVQNFQQHNTLDSIGYIQNPAIATDGTRLLVTSDFDRKIYIYNTIPDHSGVLPDQAIATNQWGISPWDNAWYNQQFAVAGGMQAAVWSAGQALTQTPAKLYSGHIGSAVFSDLKGVALDSQFFYLADRSGKVYIWNGVPANANVDPAYTLSFANAELARLSSDGEYLCVTRQSPVGVFIFKVKDIAAGNTSPWKTISTAGMINLPAETIAFNESLAIANQGGHSVLLWKDINDAGDFSKVVVLGQPGANSHYPAIGENYLFMPGALMSYQNRLWVGEFKFSSRILSYSYDQASSVSDPGLENRWRISPNPASHQVTLTGEYQADMPVVFSDIHGKIRREFIPVGYPVTIDLADFESGIYFIRHGQQVEKLIKF